MFSLIDLNILNFSRPNQPWWEMAKELHTLKNLKSLALLLDALEIHQHQLDKFSVVQLPVIVGVHHSDQSLHLLFIGFVSCAGEEIPKFAR